MLKSVTQLGDGGILVTTHGPLGRRGGTPVSEEIRYDLGNGTFRVVTRNVSTGQSTEEIVDAADLVPAIPPDMPA